MAWFAPSLLALLAVLAGCMGATDSGKSSTTTTQATMGQGVATGVTIDPPGAPAGGKSQVCWHVAGSGNVPHVAIHWDTESHALEADRTFADYDAGAAYPSNTPQLDPAGYNLPTDVCAAVDVPSSGSLYIVGHVLDRNGAPGRLSSEAVLPAAGVPQAGVAQAPTFTSIPATAPAGSMATVCWNIVGTGTVPHVAIHWDDVSHSGEVGRTFASYDLGASYPGNQSSAAPGGYALQPTGSRFCTAASMPTSGAIYVVAHVIDSAGAPGRLSDERTIAVGVAASAPSLTMRQFAFVPANLDAAPGAVVTVKNEDTVKHTATGNGFDTGDVAGGATGSFTAPMVAGDYAIQCAYHSGMQATLHVA